MVAQSVGRTPWSARVPLDPLSAPPNQPHVTRERPTRASAADRGVRPTICAESTFLGKVSDIRLVNLPHRPLLAMPSRIHLSTRRRQPTLPASPRHDRLI